MPQTHLRLTGWKAVLAIVAFIAFVAWQIVSTRASLDTEGRAALEDWIALEMQRELMASSPTTTEEEARRLLDAGEATVQSIAARGPRDDMVVRVEIAPNPAYPDGTETVRYYRVEYSPSAGWRVRGETDRAAWWLALL